MNTLSPGGAVNTKFGTGEISGHGIDPSTIRPMTVWLASDASDGFNGCRFVADRWASDKPNIDAALGCQESLDGYPLTNSSRLFPKIVAYLTN